MVVDTSLIANALLDSGDVGEAAREALRRAGDIDAPDLIRAEMTNVLAQWCQSGRGTFDTAAACLDDLEALLDEIVSATELVHYALALAVEADHPAYDALLVALAEARDTVVIAFDRQMRQRFQDRVLLVDEFLSRGT